ncbi:hypothetical protein FF011L_32620 [Roseimaritima multifibrata]|uniref:Zinc-finger domain-containing protein n=1 Tax=Roseimaritima multifibrata TaxID=1930274 RepID=A0A517MHX3_9BACT|nr:hypothetical protein [Roseimaritima multifibrata]QDS94483.1 hypothetical protein FF011L_32620 [Roseimaritima multifibrata]
MFSCKEISKLVSQSLDAPLPRRKRIVVWMHLHMCRLCAAFARDQRTMRESIHSASEIVDEPRKTHPESGLTVEAKQRIKKSLESRDL